MLIDAQAIEHLDILPLNRNTKSSDKD